MKNKQLSIRVSEKDYEKIKELAAHNNKTVSAYIVSNALAPDTCIRYSKEMMDFLQYINKFTLCMEDVLPKQKLKTLQKVVEKLWQFLNS